MRGSDFDSKVACTKFTEKFLGKITVIADFLVLVTLLYPGVCCHSNMTANYSDKGGN